MLFNSTVFLLFLAIVLPTYLVLPRRARTYRLLAASGFFHGVSGLRGEAAARRPPADEGP